MFNNNININNHKTVDKNEYNEIFNKNINKYDNSNIHL